jgi:type II secretory pathway pseudopilin PulG
MRLGSIRSRLGRPLRAEGGFTVVETMVALGVILAAVVSLAFTASAGFSKLAVARQRQDASGLANQAMEQARALPFDTIKKGLGNADLSAGGDSNITISGVDYLYGGEKIPHGDNSSVVPLVPHRSTTSLGTAIVYTVATYVTYYKNDTTSNIFRVTVVVSWNSKGGSGALKVQTQSLFYSGSGCLSGATHPFAAPCQAFFFDSAVLNPGHVTITGTLDGSDLGEAKMTLGDVTSDMQIEQIASVQGNADTSGVTYTPAGGSASVVGTQSITSGADNDPAQPDNDFGSATVSTQSGGSVKSGGGTNIVLSGGDGDTASTNSTTSASISPSHPCVDPSGVNQTDGQACGSGRTNQAGTLSAVLSFTGGAQQAGSATLATVGPSPSTWKAYTDRAIASEIAVCPSPTGDGCVHAEIQRAMGTVNLIGLPSALGVSPFGWTGYLMTLTGATQTATAEAGLGSAAPTIAYAGTLSYYNGTGYTTLVLAPGASSIRSLPNVSLSTLVNNKVMSILIRTSLTSGGAAKSDPAGCVTACTRTGASATADAPIVATVLYTVIYNGTTVADLRLDIDLGSITVKANYQAAPSG